jgi:hypothetical protein
MWASPAVQRLWKMRREPVTSIDAPGAEIPARCAVISWWAPLRYYRTTAYPDIYVHERVSATFPIISSIWGNAGGK